MKYSFMTFSCPELSLEDVLATAAEFGYDGVEPRIQAGHAHGLDTDTGARARRSAADLAKKHGVAYACVATSCKFADPETRDENVEVAHKSIDLAADIGSSRVRVFGGKLGEELERQAAVDLVAGALKELAGHAADRDVIVCMETHDDWCDPAHVEKVMEQVNEPSIATNWDIMHPVRTGLAEMEEAFETVKPWIKHVHVHDGRKPVELGGKAELTPIGEGFIDHKTAVRLLGSIKYDGFISGEWINWSDPYRTHLPREIATLRSYESEV